MSRCSIWGFLWGGIAVTGFNVLVEDSVIDSNYSKDPGGGIAVSSNEFIGSLNVEYSSVGFNSSDSVGGGIYFSGAGNSHLLNSTVTDNWGLCGGGVYAEPDASGYFEINESTIAHNHSMVGGGVFSSGSEKLTLYDSIVASNQANYEPDWFGHGETATNVLVGNLAANPFRETTGVYIVNVDPKLGPAQYLGGATLVVPLLPGSPAIDATDADGRESLDQRFAARPADGDGIPSATPYDLGAYEHYP